MQSYVYMACKCPVLMFTHIPVLDWFDHRIKLSMIGNARSESQSLFRQCLIKCKWCDPWRILSTLYDRICNVVNVLHSPSTRQRHVHSLSIYLSGRHMHDEIALIARHRPLAATVFLSSNYCFLLYSRLDADWWWSVFPSSAASMTLGPSLASSYYSGFSLVCAYRGHGCELGNKWGSFS